MTDTIERPTGRPCATCNSPHLDAVHRMLLDGATLSAVSRQFSISRSALRLHIRAHLSEDLAEQIARAGRRTPIEIVLRVHEIAERAREAAEDAQAAGDTDALVKAGAQELRAMQVLLGAGVTGEELLAGLEVMSEVTQEFIDLATPNPKLRAAIADRFIARDRRDLAEAWLREFPTNRTTDQKELT